MKLLQYYFYAGIIVNNYTDRATYISGILSISLELSPDVVYDEVLDLVKKKYPKKHFTLTAFNKV